MNAIEHGNKFRPDPAFIRCSFQKIPEGALQTRLATSQSQAGNPDLDAKLAGLQSPRGWGLFLIKNMVDGVTRDQR
jgi:hypothetical protein